MLQSKMACSSRYRFFAFTLLILYGFGMIPSWVLHHHGGVEKAWYRYTIARENKSYQHAAPASVKSFCKACSEDHQAAHSTADIPSAFTSPFCYLSSYEVLFEETLCCHDAAACQNRGPPFCQTSLK